MKNKKKCNCKHPQYQWLTMTLTDYMQAKDYFAEQSEKGYAFVITIVGVPTQPCGLPGFPPCPIDH